MVFGLFKKGTKDRAVEKAKKLMTQGRAAEAMTWFEEALEDDPANEEAKAGMAVCRRNLVEWNIEEARALTGHDPERAAEHTQLAVEIAGDDQELAKLARRENKKLGGGAKPAPRPSPPKRMFEPSCGGCASTSCAPEDEEWAESDADELFELYMEGMDEEERQCFAGLGRTFKEGYVALQQGELEFAETLLKKAEKEEEPVAATAYALGLVTSLTGKLKRAEKHFRTALERNPDLVGAKIHLAATLKEDKRAGEAVALLKERLETAPEDRSARLMLASILLEMSEPEKALEVIDPLTGEVARTEPSIAALWGHILREASDIDGAISAYQMATMRKPDMMEALIPLGVLLISKGGKDAESAVKLFKHCYRTDPERGWYHLLNIANAYEAWGKHEQAVEMVDNSRNELPDDPKALAVFEQVAAAIYKD